MRYTSIVSNLHILTGENDYVLLSEKLRWIRQFERKIGGENLRRVLASDVTIRSLLDEVSAAPFLAEKRLVVVEGMVRCSKEEARLLVGSMHADVLVLFVDPKPDKRSPGIKELLALAGENVKEFAVLKGAALSKWVEAYVRERGGSIRPDARDLLMEWNGTDQGMMAGEIDKLQVIAEGQPITTAMVERFCTPTDEGIIWKISDYLYAGKRDRAILHAHRMLSCGADAHGLWSMLLSLLKNIISVSAALRAGVGTGELPTVLGMNPFALQTMLGYCKQADETSLIAVLRWAATEEVRVKTGAYRSSQEDPMEMLALIDALLLRMP